MMPKEGFSEKDEYWEDSLSLRFLEMLEFLEFENEKDDWQ